MTSQRKQLVHSLRFAESTFCVRIKIKRRGLGGVQNFIRESGILASDNTTICPSGNTQQQAVDRTPRHGAA